MRFQLCAVTLLFTLAVEAPAYAAEKPDPSLLTLDRIFSGREFKPRKFSARWLNGNSYTKLEKSKEAVGNDIVLYESKAGKRTVLVSAAQLVPSGASTALTVENYAFSKNQSLVLIYTNSKRVWRQQTRGDYWVLDRTSHELKKLGGDAKPSTLMFAKIAPTGDRVAYVRDRNIYVEDLRTGQITAVTTTETPDIINGTFDWVYEEELRLRDGFRWSPDGKRIAFWQINTEGVRKFTIINNTDGFYPRTIESAYPKTGQRNPICRIGVADLQRRSTTWVHLPGDERDHYVARMEWAGEGNSDELVVQQLNRLQNTNRVMLVDTRKSEGDTTILTEKDDAWVNIHNEMKWLKNKAQFTWISERDGWRHLYLASRNGKKFDLVTSGEYDVIQLLHVDEKKKCAYFIASPENPTQRYLYCIQLDGTGLRRLTPSDATGTHSYSISPDGSRAIHSWSSFDDPGETELISLPDHGKLQTLANNAALRKRVQALKRQPVEIFRVEVGSGVVLDGWIMKPAGFDPKQKYPLLVYVYGEPAGQTVLDRWSGSRYLWHTLLTQRGYLIMSVDNRGTPAPRGREWRKSVYRKIGIIGPQDQAAAVREVLKSREFIDPKRVGIWGWSGGGSSSLHAIFKFPDVYHTAISIAPVPNQRYYDTIYQERYMGLPNDNVDGYRDGSAMNFAHQLKGNLLLIHGTGDDNCHYQTTELLINKLIQHNKRFTMMAYPNRTHAIKEGKNTTRHLYGLMTSYLMQNLPP